MSQTVTKNRSGNKLGAKLVRAVFYGILIGVIFFLAAFFLITAINGTAGTTVVNPTYMSLGAFAIGFTAPIATELSKDIAEE